MIDMNARSAFRIGKRPDLTVLISDNRSDQKTAQEDGVILKLHKSVLGQYEYFTQLFAAQPEMKVLELPKCDVKIPVIVDMLEYLYARSSDAIEHGIARSEITYSKYHLDLFQLSLRFYLPELEKIAVAALDQEAIGIQETAFQDMECLVVELYNNRRGRKWESLRHVVMKRQAWKLIKMPRNLLDKLDERFPGFQRELAEIWQLKLEESGASRGSWLMCWKKQL